MFGRKNINNVQFLQNKIRITSPAFQSPDRFHFHNNTIYGKEACDVAISRLMNILLWKLSTSSGWGYPEKIVTFQETFIHN